MNNKLERIFSRTVTQRRWVFGVLIAGAVVVPLVVAGLFAGALGGADHRADDIPAMVVNNDTMVTSNTPDGGSQTVLAGRQLVTELTGKSATGFNWTISNSKDASEALADGDAYAVLTIPKDFSKSVTSISGSNPTRANLSIRTDDAHSYLAGSIAQSVGSAMTSTLGKQITEQYLAGFYDQLAGMGGSLSTAADGAKTLSSGSEKLATGLNSLASGASDAADGAQQFSAGVSQYTGGVQQLSGGLASLNQGAQKLSGISSGVSSYTSGVSQTAQGFDQLAQSLIPALHSNPQLAPFAKQVKAVQSSLATLSTQGSQLNSQTAGAISGVQDGVSQSASGAARLAGQSDSVRSGAQGLVSGVSSLSSGAKESAKGAHRLSDGADTLASGLASGAKQISATKDIDASATADVVADPVGFSVSRAHPVDSVSSIIGMIFVPIGLWLGALAIFLVMKPVTSVSLASTASTGRVLFRGLARASGLALVQAVLLTGLLHLALGVSWSLIPATLTFSMLVALTFTVIHFLLVMWFKRVGAVASILLLALQLATVSGLLPLQVVSAPFQALSPFLPVTYAVGGMQAIVAGVGGAAVAWPAMALIAFAALALVVSYFVIQRKRGARSFGFAASPTAHLQTDW